MRKKEYSWVGLVWVQNSAVSGFQRAPVEAADPLY